jgi:hypothetical protein
MKFPNAMAVVTLLLSTLMTTSLSFAQSGSMMKGGTDGDGWMNGYGWMGGYGGMWLPTLLAIAVIGFLAWIITQNRK